MAKNPDFNICPICRDEIDFFSYGKCDHPTCARCAVKLRRFGSADEPDFCKCATCRARLSRMVIMTTFKPFEDVDFSILRHEVELDFFFENETVEHFYKQLMSCVCSTCGFKAPSMSALNRHTTNEHNLFFCDLCLRHAKMLPCEFVALSNKELAAHRTWDKKKKRGHPVCEFCNQTFYEFEDLVKHIREAHFLCDFCNGVGVFEVFRRQKELFMHYKESHHVCQECETTGRMTCFASRDQLGLHRMHEHPQESQSDPDRWEPLQMHFSTQGLISQYGRMRRGRQAGDDAQAEDGETNMVLYHPQPRDLGPRPEEWTPTDFPSLTTTGSNGGAPTAPTQTKPPPRSAARSLADVVGTGLTLNASIEDFPSLPGASTTPSDAAKFQQNWGDSRPKKSAAMPPSKGSNHHNQRIPQPEDFPGLACVGGSHSSGGATNWGVTTATAPKTAANSAARTTQRVPTREDFPTLGGVASSSSRLLLPQPLMPSYQKPIPAQPPKGKNNKMKNSGVPQPPKEPTQMAAASSEFGGALERAKKSQWWNEADNEGAMAKLALSDNGRTPATYTRIQTIEALEDNRPHQSASNPPPDMTPEDFPTLVSSPNNSAQQPKQPKNPKKPHEKPRPVAIAKKKSQPGRGHTEKGILDDLEDTEAILYNEAVYTPPRDFEAKNRQLIKVVEESLGQNSIKNAFSRFADFSRLFRHRQLTAQAYLQSLDGLLSRIATSATGDAHTQLDWLGSMISLLPEVSLQRALLRALRGEAAPRVPAYASPARAQPTQPPDWARLVTPRLQVCSQCGQVCLRTEIKEHAMVAHA